MRKKGWRDAERHSPALFSSVFSSVFGLQAFFTATTNKPARPEYQAFKRLSERFKLAKNTGSWPLLGTTFRSPCASSTCPYENCSAHSFLPNQHQASAGKTHARWPVLCGKCCIKHQSPTVGLINFGGISTYPDGYRQGFNTH